METTLTIDKELLNEATQLTGIEEPDESVRRALKSLIEREAARKIIELGGTQPDLGVPPRHRCEGDITK